MRIQGDLVEGVFLQRLNRFLVTVRLTDDSSRTTECHLPNPGRLAELLVPGARVLLERKPAENRETSFDLSVVYQGDTAVCIDSRVPNQLVFESLRREQIPELRGYTSIQREQVFGNSRFDFLLSNSELASYAHPPRSA